MKSEKGTEKTKIKKILAAVLLLIVFVMVRQQTAGSLEHGSLQRKEPGEGSSQKSLEAIVDGESYDINVEIAERRFTKKEVKKELKKAKKEIDATFLGDNKSLNSVKKPVVMKDSYRNGNVEAEWRLDSYDVINTEGEFVKKELPKKGVLLEACVLLSCGEETEEYSFGFHVFSPDLSVKEQIETALEKQNQKNLFIMDSRNTARIRRFLYENEKNICGGRSCVPDGGSGGRMRKHRDFCRSFCAK